MNGMNGMNGSNMAGAGIAFPTPAGHQAELNYIYGLVDELSRQLAENKRILDDVISGVGRVRSRARTQSLGNEELIASAADQLHDQEANMDAMFSVLTESLEKAKHSRDANAALLSQYASALAGMLKQFHEYKARHVADVAAWHRSYRAQLAEARTENSRLREQIWEMQAHAGKANALLRDFRRAYDDESERWESRVAARAARQELRFWRRMAMPDVPEDDAYWSDDDDVIDLAEKMRLSELEKKAAEEQLAAAAAGVDSDGGEDQEGPSHILHMPQPQQQQQSPGSSIMGAIMGGVPMQREDSGALPVPPPRPSSANSTGSTGQ